MKFKSFVSKFSPLAVLVAVQTIFVAAPAYASTAAAAGSNTLDLAAASGMLTSVIDFSTGPVAKIIAILCIIGGALAFSQGREMNEGLKNIGIIAITIGLLVGATSLFGVTVGAIA
jgi:type IV secretory pathway VirB2 component (pilin)